MSMQNTEKTCLNGNDSTTQTTPAISDMVAMLREHHRNVQLNSYQLYFQRSKEELVNNFIVEMNAKNRAYYFILENGLYEAFRDYCYKEQKQ